MERVLSEKQGQINIEELKINKNLIFFPGDKKIKNIKGKAIPLVEEGNLGKESYMIVPETAKPRRIVKRPALRSPIRGPMRMCRVVEEYRMPD